jgi:hypothetical protein
LCLQELGGLLLQVEVKAVKAVKAEQVDRHCQKQQQYFARPPAVTLKG